MKSILSWVLTCENLKAQEWVGVSTAIEFIEPAGWTMCFEGSPMQAADGMHLAAGLSCGVSIARRTSGMLVIRTAEFDEDGMLRWLH
jgi:hypothetical protein